MTSFCNRVDQTAFDKRLNIYPPYFRESVSDSRIFGEKQCVVCFKVCFTLTYFNPRKVFRVRHTIVTHLCAEERRNRSCPVLDPHKKKRLHINSESYSRRLWRDIPGFDRRGAPKRFTHYPDSLRQTSVCRPVCGGPETNLCEVTPLSSSEDRTPMSSGLRVYYSSLLGGKEKVL